MLKRHTWLHLIGLLIAAAFIIKGVQYFVNRSERYAVNNGVAETNLQIVSPAFKDGGEIPVQFTCKGQGISPPLSIAGVPESAKSLVLIMHDPDAVGGDFTHWLVWDIPPKDKGLTSSDVPVGAIQGINGAGKNGYMGPCPPKGTGTHHYVFDLYALDTTLGLKPSSDRVAVEKALEAHVIGQTGLTGSFSVD